MWVRNDKDSKGWTIFTSPMKDNGKRETIPLRGLAYSKIKGKISKNILKLLNIKEFKFVGEIKNLIK